MFNSAQAGSAHTIKSCKQKLPYANQIIEQKIKMPIHYFQSYPSLFPLLSKNCNLVKNKKNKKQKHSSISA